MGGESDQCKIVPELLPGEDVTHNRECGKSLALDVYKNLSGKTVKIEGERNSGPEAGSGFFVRNGDEIVTAGHVVKNTNSIKVEMPTGEKLDARITGYDDINDLALLKIEGLDKDPSRAVPLDRSNRNLIGEPIFSLGTPGLFNREKVLSIGIVEDRLKMQDVLAKGNPAYFAGLQDAFDTNNLSLQKDATAYVLADRLLGSQSVLPGQSGSLMVDSGGRVVGVLTDESGTRHSLATPVENVDNLLKGTGKFDFHYSKKSNYDINPLGTLGIDAAIGASTLPFVNRVAPALYGLKRLAFDLPTDLSAYSSASNGQYKTDHGRHALEDVGFGAGGLALSIGVLAKIPSLKYVGAAAYAVSFLSSTVSDFDKKHLHYDGVTRKDGSKAKPFMWNWAIDGTAVD